MGGRYYYVGKETEQDRAMNHPFSYSQVRLPYMMYQLLQNFKAMPSIINSRNLCTKQGVTCCHLGGVCSRVITAGVGVEGGANGSQPLAGYTQGNPGMVKCPVGMRGH